MPITQRSTTSSIACSKLGYNANSCPDCHAAYGHTILCPLLNRNIAEAKSAAQGALNIPDAHFLKSFHITWEAQQ